VRSLGRLGVPVYCIDADRFTPAFFSKYCRRRFVWDVDRASAQDSLSFLTGVAQAIGGRPVLIATSDLGAMLVAEHRDRLLGQFIFPNQPADLIRSLCSKKKMYHLARKWGVSTPQTAFPQSKQEVLEYLETARFPILFKPIEKRFPSDMMSPWMMSLVHGKKELLECYEAVEDLSAPNVMLQEYIPGADDMTWTFNGYFDQAGECRVAFTGRKLRNYPAYFGQASLGLCAKNSQVESATVAFMQAIGYRGPLDLGFRYDARDGQYKLNDVNPRVGAMFRCFYGQNGMDVARALYQDMTGQPVIPATTQEGRKWIVEDVDWISALRYWRDGNLTVREWLRSVRGIDESAFFSRDDLRPIAAVLLWDAARFRYLPRIRKRAPKPEAIRQPALSRRID
jgi:predicted ATP-grasp superfamily ATP-dependent carboligase